jgi:hypothetical protein
MGLVPGDPAAAQVLLTQLVQLQPARPEAAQALQAITSPR